MNLLPRLLWITQMVTGKLLIDLELCSLLIPANGACHDNLSVCDPSCLQVINQVLPFSSGLIHHLSHDQ